MVKTGIIGLGFMGLTHLRAYQNHPGVRLVAVADQVEERLAGDLSGVQGNSMAPGERHDFSKLNTYREAVDLIRDPEVELVSICLPTSLHRELTVLALKEGKHVLCEKPMALSAEDLEQMMEADAKSSGKLMIAQCIRFWPEYRRAREIVHSGVLGSVLGARLERRSALPTWGGWLMREELSGGMILDLSIHDIDFTQHLLGVPDYVRATGSCDIEGGHDVYQAEMNYGEASVYIEGGWIFPGEYPFSMAFEILCEKGVLSFHTGLERPLTIFHADGKKEVPEVAEGDGYSGEIDYFVRCIQEDRDPELSPPSESAMSVRLGHLLKLSREKRGVIQEVPEEWREG